MIVRVGTLSMCLTVLIQWGPLEGRKEQNRKEKKNSAHSVGTLGGF